VRPRLARRVMDVEEEFCLPSELRRIILGELDRQRLDAEACDRVMWCVDLWVEPCEPSPAPGAGGGTTL